ncbi:SpoIID/LytB domain-containing protein [Ornithinibacillus massiliensis]|uniref:SpoIID/LytB domain-containing protein n=1 Tax=Ornithinibacillus massiliensis TaxID=1944633 RepID=A0ABS5MDQ7_9BACI|nr:SpoIID/LytB domain-containing protein [Ornithinibacillus massiliensis]MBS3680242.1 SpoIID/LytB domain-containing protein [Ornithinibacillus massiliensis]
MRHFTFLFIIVFCLIVPVKISAEHMVTVKLVNYIGNTDELIIKVEGDFFTLDPTLKLQEGVNYTLQSRKGELFLKQKGEKEQKIGGGFILVPQTYDMDHIVYINDRPYLGAMEFLIEDKKNIRPVNQLPLEDYLKGVVPFEVFSSWGLETLKAQTLAARTYAVSKMEQVIDDTIRYQVYGGYEWDTSTTQAVEETEGEVVTYDNRLIETFYSASNGGKTENNANVWGGDSMRYFPIKDDPYDPTHPWEFTIHKTQIAYDAIDFSNPAWWDTTVEKDAEISNSLKSWLNRNGYPGKIKILEIDQFELNGDKLASGRSVTGSISVIFMRQLLEGLILFEQMSLKDVNLNQIRPMIGGTVFKSYLIDSLEQHKSAYTMKGRGFGHGVGMSQWGAHFMGEQGKTYREIIEFYYPGTTILDISSAELKIGS